MPEAYGDLEAPEDGVIVHGVYLDAGRWDMDQMKLVDAKPGICVRNSFQGSWPVEQTHSNELLANIKPLF